jgi:dihydroorotase
MSSVSTPYLIKNVRILGDEPTDILIQDGVVAEVSTPSTGSGSGGKAGVDTIQADGLIALPGLVDLHTHLREPGREDAETVETGTRAAAMGGFTAVHAMANTDPVADTAGVVEQVHRLGREAGYCDVYPSEPSPWACRASDSPSSARWPTRRPGCGCSPTTATASATRC